MSRDRPSVQPGTRPICSFDIEGRGSRSRWVVGAIRHWAPVLGNGVRPPCSAAIIGPSRLATRITPAQVRVDVRWCSSAITSDCWTATIPLSQIAWAVRADADVVQLAQQWVTELDVDRSHRDTPHRGRIAGQPADMTGRRSGPEHIVTGVVPLGHLRLPQLAHPLFDVLGFGHSAPSIRPADLFG